MKLGTNTVEDIKVECFNCGITGGKEAQKVDKANKVEDTEAEARRSNTDSIDMVMEVVNAAGDSSSKTADLPVTAMDRGMQAKHLKVWFVIDSGVNKTLWRQVESDRDIRHPKLKGTM